jgi:hypothetical protein
MNLTFFGNKTSKSMSMSIPYRIVVAAGCSLSVIGCLTGAYIGYKIDGSPITSKTRFLNGMEGAYWGLTLPITSPLIVTAVGLKIAYAMYKGSPATITISIKKDP